MIEFNCHMSDLQHQYYVYSLALDEEIKYVGFCKTKDIFQLPDAKSNSLYKCYFLENPKIKLKIYKCVNNITNANILASELIKKYEPEFNTKGHKVDYKIYPIVCLETGETFQSLDEVKHWHNVNVNSLNRHLNNDPSYPTVGGRHYQRMPGDPTKEKVKREPLKKKNERIYNKTDNIVYESKYAAARALGVSPTAVYRFFKGQQKTIAGKILTTLSN